jgi:hypothetical protein
LEKHLASSRHPTTTIVASMAGRDALLMGAIEDPPKCRENISHLKQDPVDFSLHQNDICLEPKEVHGLNLLKGEGHGVTAS